MGIQKWQLTGRSNVVTLLLGSVSYIVSCHVHESHEQQPHNNTAGLLYIYNNVKPPTIDPPRKGHNNDPPRKGHNNVKPPTIDPPRKGQPLYKGQSCLSHYLEVPLPGTYV